MFFREPSDGLAEKSGALRQATGVLLIVILVFSVFLAVYMNAEEEPVSENGGISDEGSYYYISELGYRVRLPEIYRKNIAVTALSDHADSYAMSASSVSGGTENIPDGAVLFEIRRVLQTEYVPSSVRAAGTNVLFMNYHKGYAYYMIDYSKSQAVTDAFGSDETRKLYEELASYRDSIIESMEYLDIDHANAADDIRPSSSSENVSAAYHVEADNVSYTVPEGFVEEFTTGSDFVRYYNQDIQMTIIIKQKPWSDIGFFSRGGYMENEYNYYVKNYDPETKKYDGDSYTVSGIRGNERYIVRCVNHKGSVLVYAELYYPNRQSDVCESTAERFMESFRA